MNDALSRVFRQDPELYREYVLSTQVDTPTEETRPSAPPPVVKVVEHPLAGDLLALATLFAPSDPEGMGMVKCRQALGLLRQTVERKKGAAA
jgi:hypothetical protein